MACAKGSCCEEHTDMLVDVCHSIRQSPPLNGHLPFKVTLQQTLQYCYFWEILFLLQRTFLVKQECIPVGCVQPAHWPYLIEKTTHAPLKKPHMPPLKKPCMPPRKTTMPPWSSHAWPPRASTHAPPSNHACPPRATTHAPPEQPCMPPGSNHTHPLGATMHAPSPRATMHAPGSNHTCPPKQPRMPPTPWSNHACPPGSNHTRPPPVDRMTDTCKKIAFANFVCGR